jgi:hypothetical protein
MKDRTSKDRPEPGARRERRWLLLTVLLFVAVAAVALGFYWPQPQGEESPKALTMGWRPILSQSARGSLQTDSFHIETGQWRVKWTTVPAVEHLREPETPLPSAVSPSLEFQLGVHSAVSGRLMTLVVDHQGAGRGVAYVAEEPRLFFLAIQSTGLDWTVQVEEGLVGERQQSY